MRILKKIIVVIEIITILLIISTIQVYATGATPGDIVDGATGFINSGTQEEAPFTLRQIKRHFRFSISNLASSRNYCCSTNGLIFSNKNNGRKCDRKGRI